VEVVLCAIADNNKRGDEPDVYRRYITLKKNTFILYLALYLVTLFLAGATRMHRQDALLHKLLSLIWSLMPSQNFRWFALSFIVLVILLLLVFVAGYFLIARFETLLVKLR